MLDIQIYNAQTMECAIRELGIVPFFPCSIPGYSIREMTVRGCWFYDEEGVLGPWDWKIDCVQSGDILYGKFLCGGKAAFATTEWYKELMNIRRAKMTPDADGQKILAYLGNNSSIGSKELRELLGVKKSAADAAITRLQHQCRVVIGDITRVYRGPNLTYEGWQRASYCTPEALFPSDDSHFPAFPGCPFASEVNHLATQRTPEESLEALAGHIAAITNSATRKEILKVLR